MRDDINIRNISKSKKIFFDKTGIVIVSLKCQYCGKVYYRIPAKSINSKYCSRDCHNRGRDKKKLIVCKVCGKEKKVHRNEITRKFCSRECQIKGQKRRSKMKLNKQEIINLYKKYKSADKVAKLKGCSRSPIDTLLKENNIERVGNKRKEIDEKLVCNLYKQGKSSNVISKEFGCSSGKVDKILKLNKTKKRTISESHIGQVPHNKGKDLIEIYGKRRAKEIRKKLIISSKEFMKNNPDIAKERIKKMQKAGKTFNTKIELLLKEELIKRGYKEKKDFISQFRLKGIIGCMDFAFFDYKLIIECDGDYWHGNPKLYKTLSPNQKKQRKKDRLKERIIKEQGWNIIRFWGTEIERDVVVCINKIEEKIKKKKLLNQKRHNQRSYPNQTNNIFI
ncbi:MAG: DUF559 domain-containing protein [archaeon]